MQRKANEAERAGAPRIELTEQYRPIGPAAVLAAVIYAAKTIEKAEKAEARKKAA